MTASNQNRAPTHRLYVVHGDDKTARWVEIGAAWENRDGKGFTLSLDATPIGGRLVMRAIAAGENGGQS